MTTRCDGPASPQFAPLRLAGNTTLDDLAALPLSEAMRAALPYAPRGRGVSWGIPFEIDRVVAVEGAPVTVPLAPTRAGWLVFWHASDARPLLKDDYGLISPIAARGRSTSMPPTMSSSMTTAARSVSPSAGGTRWGLSAGAGAKTASSAWRTTSRIRCAPATNRPPTPGATARPG